MIVRIISLFALLAQLSLCAQESTFTQAEIDFSEGRFAKAYQEYKKAGAEFLDQNDYPNYALCNLKMAKCHLSEGKADLGVQLSERTLNYINEVIVDKSLILPKCYSVLGESYLNLGRNDLALATFSKEEVYYFEKASLDAAKCYNNLGVVYWNSGNKTTARSYLDRSLKIKENLLDSEDPSIADSYINIGLIYLEEDRPKEEYYEAISYFNKALNIYESIYGGQHTKVALCYGNIASVYSYLESYAEALQYLDLVMEIWDNTFEGDHPKKAFTLSSIGRVFEKKGDLDKAIHHQEMALHQYLRIYGDKHPEVANTYFLIGNIYQAKNKYGLAAKHFQASIYANLFTQASNSLYDQPKLEAYYNADILLTSLTSKASAMEALHYEKTLKPRDLIAALDTYIVCDELISQIRQLRLSEADKLKLGATSATVYDNGIRIALAISAGSWQKDFYLNKAFEFCERSKSSILLEAIQETKAKSFSGIPENLLRLEDSLKNEISFLKQKLAKASDEKQDIKDQLFGYEQSYRSFIDQLETEYPAYFNLKYNHSLATVAEIQGAMNSQTAVLSYFTGEQDIHVFIITKNDFEVITIPKAKDFFQTCKAFRNSIKYDVFEIFELTSLKLHDQLIPKLNKRINQLIIIPDGVLGTLPFEAFAYNIDTKRVNYAQLSYLVEKYAISYDYAASLLLDRLSKTATTSSNGILLAAPVSFDDNELIMPELPDTKTEINEIKYLFLASDQEPTVLLNQRASEGVIKEDKLYDYKYLHFATHGLVNESKPELSRVFLSLSEGEDGSLYSGEIYNLKINADLVTLSACETGLGKLAKGEGIVGLSRSLMYAGAHNLIVSLWQVADASTAQLMIEFYRQHLHHSSNNLFNDDLQKAKLSLLHSENYSSPYYWAPFILVGD